MPLTIKALIENGAHFGHRTSRWNPQMEKFIFGKRNQIHIINVRETIKGVLRAKHLLRGLAANNQDVLFVGTKRQIKSAISGAGTQTHMPYVAERWLGGTFTNFRTIKSRVKRLEHLEDMEVTGSIKDYSKKVISKLMREKGKLMRNLEGIRKMGRLPAAVVVVDPKKEHIVVEEAHKTNIPVIGLVDTDGNPAKIDVVIPCNDDSLRCVRLILNELSAAIVEGKKNATLFASQNQKRAEKPEAPQQATAPQA